MGLDLNAQIYTYAHQKKKINLNIALRIEQY